MARRFLPRILPIVATVALGGLSSGARAQSGGGDAAALAAGQALYEEATKAMDAGNYTIACPKLEEVVKLAPQGVGARFDLARCYEGAKRLASAYASYVLAETMAAAANRAKLQKQAHDGAAALKPRLAKLTIVVGDGVRELGGLEIQRDGVPVGSAQWGVAIPVDNGRHVVVAKATGKQPWEKAIEVDTDGVGTTMTIDALVDARAELPAVAPPPPAAVQAPPPAAVAPPPPAAVQAPPPAAAEPPKPAPGSAKTPAWAWVSGGIGVVALGVGAGFGAAALAKQSSIASACGPHFPQCPADPQTRTTVGGLVDTRDLDRGVFIGLAAAGAVGIGAGILGIATAGPSKKDEKAEPAGVTLSLFASPGGGALVVAGGF